MRCVASGIVAGEKRHGSAITGKGHSMTRWLLALCVLLGSRPGPQADPPIEAGTLTLQFQLDARVRADVDPKVKLVGTVYGDLYLAEDVTVVGPIDDAKAYASIAAGGLECGWRPRPAGQVPS